MIKGSKFKAIIYNRLPNFFCLATNIDREQRKYLLVVQCQGNIK